MRHRVDIPHNQHNQAYYSQAPRSRIHISDACFALTGRYRKFASDNLTHSDSRDKQIQLDAHYRLGTPTSSSIGTAAHPRIIHQIRSRLPNTRPDTIAPSFNLYYCHKPSTACQHSSPAASHLSRLATLLNSRPRTRNATTTPFLTPTSSYTSELHTSSTNRVRRSLPWGLP
jgi:hypothetical protein